MPSSFFARRNTAKSRICKERQYNSGRFCFLFFPLQKPAQTKNSLVFLFSPELARHVCLKCGGTLGVIAWITRAQNHPQETVCMQHRRWARVFKSCNQGLTDFHHRVIIAKFSSTCYKIAKTEKQTNKKGGEGLGGCSRLGRSSCLPASGTCTYHLGCSDLSSSSTSSPTRVSATRCAPGLERPTVQYDKRYRCVWYLFFGGGVSDTAKAFLGFQQKKNGGSVKKKSLCLSVRGSRYKPVVAQ